MFERLYYFSLLLLLFKCDLSNGDGKACGDKKKCTCANYVMDCRNQGLTEFPGGIDKDIKALYLNNNQITEINQIPEKAELQTLDLTNNEIQKLSYDTFDNLDNLKILILTNNKISTIADDIFEWNPLKLEVLHLDGNMMEFIQHFLFYDLEQLTDLYLQNNNITFIHPHAFLQLKNLINLRLDGNKLHTFHHEWIEKLQPNSFQELRFDNNEWSCDCAMNTSQVWLKKAKISKWFIDLTTNHPIKCATPRTFKDKLLVDLTTEELEAKCDFPVIVEISSPAKIAAGRDVLLRCVVDKTKFPQPTISWSAPNHDVYRLNTAVNFDGITVHQDGSLLITNLSMSDNGTYSCSAANVKGHFVANTVIRVEPASTVTPHALYIAGMEAPVSSQTGIAINNCPKDCQCVSRRVDCAGDEKIPRTEIPKDIPKNAITISFATNRLTRLGPRAFADFKDLVELRLDINEISDIDARAFEGLDGLTTLTLQDNKLSHIKSGTFSPLKNLNVLVLDKNKLTSITDDTFKGLDNLQWLYIRRNTIKIISGEAFKPLKKIKFIHLESNQIRVLYPDTIEALTTRQSPSIKKIFIVDNAIQCDNNMEEMRLFLREPKNLIGFPNLFEDGIECSYPAELSKKFLRSINMELRPTAVIVDGSSNSSTVNTVDQTEKVSNYFGAIALGVGGIALGVILTCLTIVLFVLWKKYERAARTPQLIKGLKDMKQYELAGI